MLVLLFSFTSVFNILFTILLNSNEIPRYLLRYILKCIVKLNDDEIWLIVNKDEHKLHLALSEFR